MISGKLRGALLALALSSVGVDAHRHGIQHQHHKRDEGSCACVPVVTTTWIEYVPSDWTTSYTTVVETHLVYVDIEETMTVTSTLTEDDYVEATPSAGWKVKRNEIAKRGEDCGCFEKVITTWVAYEPEDVATVWHASSYVESSAHISSKVKSRKVLPASSSTPTSTYVAPTSTYVPPPPPSSTWTPPASAPAPAIKAAAYVAAPAPAPAPASTSATWAAPASTPVTASGGLYAITYTPYDPTTGACKSASSILSDLSTIQAAGFPRIRLYSVDCSTLENVATPAVKMGFKVTLGVFFDSTGATRGNADLTAILEWCNWQNIEVINIGNEAVSQGFMSSTALISFIESATTKLRAAGYTGIISTAETVGTFQTYPGICTCLESTVHSNIHGYFSSTCQGSDAGSFVLSQISLVEKACGKSVIVSESGWPSSGPSDGSAIASPSAQAAAIASLKAITGEALITFFSYTNDLWKAPGVEQAFGMWADRLD